MPGSKAEQALDALKALLEMVPQAVVERYNVLPEKVPSGGLIILRDGDPEQALGGFGSTYYQHAVEIGSTEESDAAARDAAFDALLQEIGSALEADPTLGGLALPDLWASRAKHRGNRGRTSDQDRDADRHRRLRDGNAAGLRAPGHFAPRAWLPLRD